MRKTTLLHCVSDHPVEDKEANLISIQYLKDKFKINIGHSDHTHLASGGFHCGCHIWI